METEGIEPSFPQCDCGVFPLHYVPGIHQKVHFILKTNRFQDFFGNRGIKIAIFRNKQFYLMAAG